MQNPASNPPADLHRLIAKNLGEMVMAYDMERKLVFVNPAVETLTGYSTEELEKDNFICWIHPDDQARMLTLWDALFQGKPYHEAEYRLVTKDGRMKWVVATWTPLLDDHGRQVGVQGREVDITSRKLAETAHRHSDEQLRADQKRYRGLFENSPFPMWEEDFSGVRSYLDALAAEGVSDVREYLMAHREAVEECVRRVRVLDVNCAARNFYRAASKEELLVGLSQVFDEPDFEVFREEISWLAEGNSSFQIEFPARTLAGEERRVDMIVSIVDSARRDWSRVIVSFFDVTDRKRLEEEFAQSQKMESLGRLAGGIAHDFNNLLTVINGYTDWVLSEIGSGHPLHVPLSEVRKAGEQCAGLTAQLLAFSRKQVVRPGSLDLNRLIRESQTMLGHVLGDDIRICIRLAGDLGNIVADRGQMHQVLMNLAVNAREAMPGGGTLTIETSRVEEPPRVLLEISDTGQGIDENTRRHLFEPFFTTKKNRKNTGLGLATVFGIVNQGGGQIDVQSEPGSGAVFRIYLPRADGIPEPPQECAPAGRSRLGTGIVLVVEDRQEVRNLTCRMLEELGYQAVPAAGGEEALVIARRQRRPIPLLLTDVVMPGMDGREVSERLQQIHPRVKTIFMSGYTDRSLSGADTPDSAVIYLQKPFTLAQLADTLRIAEER